MPRSTQTGPPDPEVLKADQIARELAGQPAGESRRRRRSPAPRPEPDYLMTHEVAERLHVSPKTVSRWAKEGRLPVRILNTIGKHRRYHRGDVEALARDLTTQAAAERDQAGA